MRKCFLTFLMFLMVAPGLACGPFMAAHKAEAAQPAASMADCHDMDMTSYQQDSDKVMFFKDCLNVDLQSAGFHADVTGPDTFGKVFFVSWADTVPAAEILPGSADAIRGPPPDWPAFSLTRPATLLTTQRFRE